MNNLNWLVDDLFLILNSEKLNVIVIDICKTMKNRPKGQKMAILTDIHMKESNGCSKHLNMSEKNRTQICALNTHLFEVNLCFYLPV